MDASDWDRKYAAQDLLWSAEPNRFVAAELSLLPAGRALDLACGEGRNAIWLAERGWRVRAVDFSSVAVDRGKGIAQRRGVEVDFEVADLSTFRAEPAAYDLVVVAYLHLPWPQMQAVLQNAAEAVAPGGQFLLVGHDHDNLTAGHGGPQDAAVLYTPDQVAAVLEGFEIDKAVRVRRPVATATGDVEAIDNLVRATRRCAV